MYIYTYMGQAQSPEGAQRICAIFGHLSSSRLAVEPGYRRGECAVSADDPRQVFIHEHWGNLASLRAWLDSDAHRTMMAQIEPFLVDSRFETHVYNVLSGGPS